MNACAFLGLQFSWVDLRAEFEALPIANPQAFSCPLIGPI